MKTFQGKCTHPEHEDGVSCEETAVGCHEECPCCMGGYSARVATIARETAEQILSRVFDDCQTRKDGTLKGLHSDVKSKVQFALLDMIPFEWIVKIYNAGYAEGHQATIENRYMEVHPEELVHEMLNEIARRNPTH